MTAINASPLLLREVAAAGDAYQIDKSLKFNADDSAHLINTVRKKDGNRRAFTVSFWIKNCKEGTRWFSTGYDSSNSNYREGYIGFNSNQLTFWHGNASGGTAYTDMRTNMVFRDPSAWYHIVIATDTNATIEKERVKIYVNGKEQTSFSSSNYPSLGTTFSYLKASSELTLGCWKLNGNLANFHDGLFADWWLIDGLQVPASAWGSFDSMGVWNPKTFALPTPNQNVTHSSTMVSSTGSWQTSNHTSTAAFDGLIGQGASGSSARPSTNTASVTWTPTTEIPFTHSVQARSNACNVELTLTDDTLIEVAAANDEHKYLYYGNSKIKSIKWTPIGTVFTDIQGVWVDGILLEDDEYDVTTLYNPNDGTTWSSGTATGTLHGAWANLFNGLTDGNDVAASGNSGASAELTLPASISWKSKLRLLGWLDHASCKIELTIGGTTTDYANLFTANPAAVEWKTITTTAGSLTKIKLTSHESGGSNNRARLYAIEVDGQIVTDAILDTGFNLKFNDVSVNKKLGKDTLHGKIEDATGGLPILKTSDDYGDVKDSGTRDDDDKANLLLAVPFDTTTPTDYHATIKGSGTNRTLTTSTSNTAYATTTDARFYGAAANMATGTGGGSNVSGVTTTTDADDFEVSTGDFTLEFWAKWDPETTTNSYIFSLEKSNGGSPYPLYIFRKSSGAINNWNNDFDLEQFSNVGSDGKWHHYALVRHNSGKTFTGYIDGRKDTEIVRANAYDMPAVEKVSIGHYHNAYNINGLLQEVRFYNKAKYTDNFRPPSRNDFDKVTNLITGTSTGTTTGGSWNSAFKKDSGTSWNNADDWDISSGSSMSTNGNAQRLYIDTQSLGDSYELVLTDTGGANAIYFANQADDDPDETSNWDLLQNNCSEIIITPAGAKCDGTLKTHKRYLRAEGAGGGNVTITITGVLDLDEGTSTSTSDLDSLVDSPTNYAPDSGEDCAGGVTRGNYCTLNPLAGEYGTFGQANLQFKGTSVWTNTWATIAYPKTGKWYVEAEFNGANPGSSHGNIWSWIGITKSQDKADATYGTAYTFTIHDTGHYNNFSASSAGTITKPADGDVYGIIWDAGARKISIFRNNTVLLDEIDVTSNISTNDTVFLANGSYYSSTGWQDFNFGQRAFKYNRGVTESCKTLCTQNLPDTFSGAAKNDPSKYFDIKLYTGDDTTDGSKKVKFPFSPDLAWLKSRSVGYDHRIFDRIRGQGSLVANKTDAVYSDAWSSLTTFDSDGISIEESAESYNKDGETYVAWAWDAGTTASSNDSGSIDVASGNQWVNTAAGFSITKYTGTGSSATVGHGLGAKPKFIIVRRADSATGGDWAVQHTSLSADKVMWLNKNDAAYTDTGDHWLDAEPTDTVFTIKDSANVNASSGTYMAYCWTDIPGYSAFGSYKATNNTNGPMINLGFQPRWIMFKNRSSTWGWYIHDTERSVDNSATEHLIADLHNAEATYAIVDILSNGFKLTKDDEQYNDSTDLYIYAAFAEFPFKLARAR